jgi:undecaprenyl-diphosphatase
MDQRDLAEWIGAHVFEFLSILSLLTLLIIFFLWRTIETYHNEWWQLGNRGWEFLKSLSPVQRLYGRYPQVWQILQKRLSPLGYLELYLIVGLLIIGFITFNLFGGLAEQVTEQEEIVSFDQALASSLYQNASPGEVSFFRAITILAGRAATIGIGIGIAIVLIVRRKMLLLLSWATAILGNSLLNAILKAAFQRSRPAFPDPFLVETNWSFPSGHAMGAMVIYGMLTYLLILQFKQNISKIIVLFMVALILLIGFSRLYLGVHYFSDVMAGYIVGLGWLSVVISGTEIVRRHSQWRRRRTGSTKMNSETRLTGVESS